MPSKRTMRKDKPEEVIRRLRKLRERIASDHEKIRDIKKSWHKEYRMNTATEKLLKEKGQSRLACTEDDLVYDEFPLSVIDQQIDLIVTMFPKVAKSC